MQWKLKKHCLIFLTFNSAYASTTLWSSQSQLLLVMRGHCLLDNHIPSVQYWAYTFNTIIKLNTYMVFFFQLLYRHYVIKFSAFLGNKLTPYYKQGYWARGNSSIFKYSLKFLSWNWSWACLNIRLCGIKITSHFESCGIKCATVGHWSSWGEK